MTDASLRLDAYELNVVVNRKKRSCRVVDNPHDGGSDLDRIAVAIVDLEHPRLVIADPCRHAIASSRGVHPPETGPADRALVAACEPEHHRLAGRDRYQSSSAGNCEREE